MGTDKASLEIDGRAMAWRCAEAMHQAGLSPVVAVGGVEATITSMGLTHLADEWPGDGPLGAVICALDHIETDIVIVMSCDLLDPSRDAVVLLRDSLGEHDVAVPVVEGHAQWLQSAWNRSCRTLLRTAFLAGERSIRGAVVGLGVRRFRVDDPTAYRDADRPADLAARSPRFTD